LPEGASFVFLDGPGSAVAPSLDAAADREGRGAGIQLYEGGEGWVVCVSATIRGGSAGLRPSPADPPESSRGGGRVCGVSAVDYNALTTLKDGCQVLTN